MINLSNLKPSPGSRKPIKRLGRGEGSGLGSTSGRGHKGQKSRSGSSISGSFEGGQMPIYRRLPKRGFKNPFRQEYLALNIQDILAFEPNSTVDVTALMEKGKIKKTQTQIKLLAKGEIDFPLTVKLSNASKAAIEKIEKAGGKFEAV